MEQEHKVGDTVHVVQVRTQRGAPALITVVVGTVGAVHDDACTVTLADSSIELPKCYAFHDAERAEERRFAIIAWAKARGEIARNGGRLAPLPSPLNRHEGVVASSNPLRIGEPNIAFSAQSNAWGATDSPQKVIQRLASIFEDIEHLDAMLSLIPHGTEYAKRLISKYVVLELQAAFDVLKGLARLDPAYGSADFPTLENAIKALDAQHQFRMVRNKISAHRDGNLDVIQSTDLWKRITRRAVWSYLDAFEQHLSRLAARYPMEMQLYFAGRGRPLALAISPGSPDYLPFDPSYAAHGLSDPHEATSSEDPDASSGSTSGVVG